MPRIHLFGQNPHESIYGLESEYISFFAIEYEYNYPWRDMDLSPQYIFYAVPLLSAGIKPRINMKCSITKDPNDRDISILLVLAFHLEKMIQLVFLIL